MLKLVNHVPCAQLSFELETNQLPSMNLVSSNQVYLLGATADSTCSEKGEIKWKRKKNIEENQYNPFWDGRKKETSFFFNMWVIFSSKIIMWILYKLYLKDAIRLCGKKISFFSLGKQSQEPKKIYIKSTYQELTNPEFIILKWKKKNKRAWLCLHEKEKDELLFSNNIRYNKGNLRSLEIDWGK